MPLDYIVSTFLTLLVVVDPVGLAPTFLAVTDGMPREARRSLELDLVPLAVIEGQRVALEAIAPGDAQAG